MSCAAYAGVQAPCKGSIAKPKPQKHTMPIAINTAVESVCYTYSISVHAQLESFLFKDKYTMWTLPITAIGIFFPPLKLSLSKIPLFYTLSNISFQQFITTLLTQRTLSPEIDKNYHHTQSCCYEQAFFCNKYFRIFITSISSHSCD